MKGNEGANSVLYKKITWQVTKNNINLRETSREWTEMTDILEFTYVSA